VEILNGIARDQQKQNETKIVVCIDLEILILLLEEMLLTHVIVFKKTNSG